MTTITIERELLEQALSALLLPCDRWNGVQYRIVKEASDAVLSALAAPATAPEECWCDEQGIGEPGVSCGDCPARDYKAPATAPEPLAYTTGLYGGRFTLEPVNPAVAIPKGFALYLHPPKEKQPSWQDAPTEIGRWLCARPHGAMFTCIISNVEKSERIGGVRWFGPISPDSGDKQ